MDTLRIDADAMQQHAVAASRLLRALANGHRPLLRCRLVTGEHRVSELNAGIDIGQSPPSCRSSTQAA